jgi:hypothetical protein
MVVPMSSSSIRARPADTDPEAERVQIELMRRAGVGGRVRLAASLTRTVIALARRAIRHSLPDSTEEDVGLRFVELHYGRELAAEVRRYLATRRR